MLSYSYADTRELAPNMEDLRADGPLDAFGRDVDDFDDSNFGVSLSEYVVSLTQEDVDARSGVLAKGRRSHARGKCLRIGTRGPCGTPRATLRAVR